MKKILIVTFLVFAFFQVSTMKAQDLLKGNDLSTLKVDYLSDSDVAKIRTQLETNKVTIEQAEPMALAKGMSANEFAKLKARLGMNSEAKNATVLKNKNADETTEEDSEEYTRKQEKIVNKKVKDSLNALVFGSELFDNPTLNFEPNLK